MTWIKTNFLIAGDIYDAGYIRRVEEMEGAQKLGNATEADATVGSMIENVSWK